MAAIRCWLFNLLFYSMTATLAFVALPMLLLPRPAVLKVAWLWGFLATWLARHVCGIRLEVRGRENLPEGPVVVAAKHQSAYDTVIYHLLLNEPIFVLKKELLFLPLFGLYLWRKGSVAIDRSAGASAMKQLIRQAKERIVAGHPLIIFPEGTRTNPDAENPPYHPGVAALYTQLDVPIVPVATNSGLCWGKNAAWKRSGTVVVEFLEPIQPGEMDRKTFMKTLQSRIENKSKALAAERRKALPST